MKFEFYVLNYNINKQRVEMFNIFQNSLVNEATEKAVKKYLRSPSKFTYEFNNKYLTGFDALCEEIRVIIAWQERSRCQYEITVGNEFNGDVQEKWDCYRQCEPNIKMIARQVIWQYKHNKT